MPSFVFKEPETWPTALQRVGPDGAVLGEFKSVAQWFKRFVRHLSGDERTFLFVDSRFSVQHLVPMRAKNMHVVYVLHNIHVAPAAAVELGRSPTSTAGWSARSTTSTRS